MAQINPLKALIQRLTSTPVEDLPSIAYFLASSISGCIISPQNSGTDRAALLHKLKARISSLLQDRTPEGRLTAVIVAKAVIEAGGREILVDSEPWIRGLIAIFNKSDPAATKRLAITTVSRAFVLTQNYPSIVREVTTPLLPLFNTACLAAIRPKTTKTDKGTHNVLSPLLLTALQCWNELLPQHPATFRPFVTRFRPICMSLLSDAATPDSISRAAGALLMVLHHSAPKNTASSEWSQLCQDTIRAGHATAESLFRSVREDWTFAESGLIQSAEKSHLYEELPSGGPDVLGLAEWVGMHDGAKRLSRLLGLLEASVSAVTATEVPIPLSAIMDLCTRLLALTIPGTSKDSRYTLRPKSEFGKDEREMLWSEMPTVHVNCLRLLSVVVESLQNSILPISKSIIDRVTWLFDAEHELPVIRASAYELLRLLLPTIGPTADGMDVEKLSGMILRACRDLLPTSISIENHEAREKGTKTAAVNVDSFAGPTKLSVDQKICSQRSALQSEAVKLASVFLECVPACIIPNTLRSEIDRTAVLTQDKRALLASVLNPATARQGQHAPASLLPFLAHADSEIDVEALLRPRMAVITDNQSHRMRLDNTESESEKILENKDLSNGNSVLDRLGEALKAPKPAIVEETAAFDKFETPAAAGSNAVIEDDIQHTATKRDFAAMNEDGLNGWHTAVPSTVPVADTDAKKVRVNEHALSTQSLDDKGIAEGQLSTNGHFRTDVGMTDRDTMQHEQPSVNIQAQLVLEPDTQPILKSGSKGKSPAIDRDDSDFDIPEINVEPDTDEDDEDDEDMYG